MVNSANFLAAADERDWPTIASMLDQDWLTLFFSPETAPACWQVLIEIPETFLRERPKLAFFGEIQTRLPHHTAQFNVPDAAQLNRIAREGRGRELIEVSTVAMIARRVSGHFTEATEIVDAILPFLKQASATPFSPATGLAGYWYLQAGQATLFAGHVERANLLFELAWTYRVDDITGYVAPSVAPIRALTASFTDDRVGWAHWNAVIDQHATEWSNLIEASTMSRQRLLGDLLQATHRGDTAASGQLVAGLDSMAAFDEYWAFSLLGKVRHLINIGEPAQARRAVALARELHSTLVEPGSINEAIVETANASLTRVVTRNSTDGRVATLTAREYATLQALAEPGSLPEIADRLYISKNTLKTHLRSLYAKLDVSAREEAIEKARDLGLL